MPIYRHSIIFSRYIADPYLWVGWSIEQLTLLIIVSSIRDSSHNHAPVLVRPQEPTYSPSPLHCHSVTKVTLKHQKSKDAARGNTQNSLSDKHDNKCEKQDSLKIYNLSKAIWNCVFAATLTTQWSFCHTKWPTSLLESFVTLKYPVDLLLQTLKLIWWKANTHS